MVRVYDRIAPIYDLFEAPMEWLGGRRRRERVIQGAHGDVLEIGVGTGRNLSLYPGDTRVTAIDISPRMLDRARKRAARSDRPVELREANVRAAGLEIVDVRCAGIWREIVARPGSEPSE